MQKGYIYEANGAWHLRYRLNGKQISQKLADYNDQYRTKRSVRPLADDVLMGVNQGTATAETVQQFIDQIYFPHAELNKRASTVKGYRNLYNLHISHRVAGIRVSLFRTKDGQMLLNKIATEHPLSHQTLVHIKSFLSGVFTFAKRMGSLDSQNPMEGVEVPKGKQSKPTRAYSAREIDAMVAQLEGVGRTAVIVAAYTGLSLGELRGLQWQDITEEELTVNRTFWHAVEGPPKALARHDSIPLLPIVKRALDEHKSRSGHSKWVFEGLRGKPLDLATLGSKRIKKALNGKVEWLGWHALRRGFATRLHELGVQDRTIQALMRHSSLSVTMKHYVKATPQASRDAMERLNKS
jgi:integrase